jgi:hypothetical protein
MKISDTTRTIRDLNQIDPSNEYAYESAVLAFLKLGGLPLLTYTIPSGTVFYRTRTHDSEVLFPKISSISLAPKKNVEKFARCNRPFQQVFYCSENRITSYMELVENWISELKPGDKVYVTIGKWELLNDIEVIIVTSPNKTQRTSDYDREHGEALDTFLNSQTGETKEAQIIFYQFLYELFRKPAKDNPLTYIITTAYCNVALMHSVTTNGVYYPSVPFLGNGINLAISSRFISNTNINLDSALMNEFTVSLNTEQKLTFTETKKKLSKEIKTPDNKISW